MVRLTNPQTSRSLLFTGDYGSGSSPFLADQDQVERATWAIIEGTYGPERTPTGREERTEFQELVARALKEDKRVIIPSFVLDRSQQVLREISNGIKAGLIPAGQKVKIFSPSIEEINRIYSDIFTMPKFTDYFRGDYGTVGPFDDICRIPPQGNTEVAGGEIANCSSGMADSGYSLGFVKRWIDDPRTIFIFVGYQSPLTVGGRLTRLKDIKNIHLVNGTVIRGRVIRENPGMLLIETDRGRRAVPKIQVVGRKPATPPDNY